MNFSAKSMLEHQKSVLRAVANDQQLFRKELIKSFKWLNGQELIQLHEWLCEEFGSEHHEIISQVFFSRAV